jgi:L-threonylcarbamoyladenylate synthase
MSLSAPQLISWPTELSAQKDLAARAARTLRSGGLVVYPTDTVYGLAADPSRPESLQRIYEVKGRPDEKAIAWLVASVDSARSACALDARSERLASRFWPGPLTLVLRRIDPPPGALPTLGVRMPAHPAALAIISAFGGPLATTSANRSGEPSAQTATEALATIGFGVDLIIDAGPAPGGTESTVVDLSEGDLRILRSGAVPADQIEAAIST